MKGRKKKKSNSAKRSFDPNEVASALHSALIRDFKEAQHVYCLNDSVTLYAFNRQVNELRKKFTLPGPHQDELKEMAYDKFKTVNNHMREVNARLKQEFREMPVRCLKSLPDRQKIHLRARQLVHLVLGQLDTEAWFQECKNSSGTSLGVPYRDTSLENKFRYPLSATKHAERIFRGYLQWDEGLAAAIDEHNGPTPDGEKYSIVDSSRATTVDKNDTQRRFIAIEPTCNMYLQQGLMELMYNLLKRFGLDVATLPDIHRQLARYGSIHCQFATIDWSSASDCVSIELLRWLMPTEWFRAMTLVRCYNTEINGEVTPLHMISSMGNATTFPLELLVFWAYAVATQVTLETDTTSVLLTQEDCKKSMCSVFGDDCIVPSSIAEPYMALMVENGFIVNKEKSCYGPMQFRESCGGDYLNGYNIRPHHMRAPSSDRVSALEPWLYIQANALLRKYIQYFGELSYVYDKELWRTIFGLFSQYKLRVKLVPSSFPDDSGLKIGGDIQRFRNHYSMRLSRIDTSKHGTVRFLYCNYRYRETLQWNEQLRYQVKLKKFVMLERRRELPHEYQIRKRGGYVVASAKSCHWRDPIVAMGG